MFLKVHKVGKEVIVALCDAELLGKTLREGAVVLDLKKYGDFYKGEKADEKIASKAVEGGTSINAVGKRSVSVVRKALKCDEASVRMIQKVPHLQVYRF
ncbi:MAG: DUF424 family protein [Candidatus Micrarchaeia archaeon]|jgi:hypothetical protein